MRFIPSWADLIGVFGYILGLSIAGCPPFSSWAWVFAILCFVFFSGVGEGFRIMKQEKSK